MKVSNITNSNGNKVPNQFLITGNALAEYMQNQPSSISLPCYYHEQIELAKEFGSIPQDATEKQEQKIIDNFYNFFTNYLLQLKRTMKI